MKIKLVTEDGIHVAVDKWMSGYQLPKEHSTPRIDNLKEI
jgi:hypothetical protein